MSAWSQAFICIMITATVVSIIGESVLHLQCQGNMHQSACLRHTPGVCTNYYQTVGAVLNWIDLKFGILVLTSCFFGQGLKLAKLRLSVS